MSVITLDFQPDILISSQTKKLDFIYRPYVFIKLGNGNKWSKNFIRSLIDSGADYNVFPSAFAKEIGINYEAGQKHKTTGVGGQLMTTYLHVVKIKVNSREIDTVVSFGKEIETPLLGRQGFFNYFDRITFIVKSKTLELEY